MKIIATILVFIGLYFSRYILAQYCPMFYELAQIVICLGIAILLVYYEG